MFAVAFGLSMDYEVFLLGRVREEWRRSGDPHRSVVAGLASTGRLITAAAAIMVAVFIGFATEGDLVLKQIGAGLAVAILVDATVVRMVLVPATMALLGRWNWWLPGWLDRVLPHLDVEPPAPRIDTAAVEPPVDEDCPNSPAPADRHHHPEEENRHDHHRHHRRSAGAAARSGSRPRGPGRHDHDVRDAPRLPA